MGYSSRGGHTTDDCHLIARGTDFIAMRGRFHKIVALADCDASTFHHSQTQAQNLHGMNVTNGLFHASFPLKIGMAGSQREVFVP